MVNGGLTEIELIAMTLEKLQIRAARHLPILAAERARVNRSLEKSEVIILEDLGYKLNKRLTDGSQPHKVAVTSLLGRHSPSEAKKRQKKQHPNHLSGRLGLVYVKRLLSSSSVPRTTG